MLYIISAIFLNEQGFANIIISKRREPSDKGVTHYVTVDTWKPEKKKDNIPF